ncbi:NACHT domain-containing protein [Streptomyces phaeofaciens]|uniref:NACHT domain-containing protein n=1 Tax=Streptomyces phaeofaciens TaxID=68254 RepID=UPI0036C0E9AE
MASTVYAVLQLVDGGLGPGDTGGLLGLPIGLVGLVVAVFALRRPVEGDNAERARVGAKTLARQVMVEESAVRRQLLGDDNRPINLAYDLHPAGARPTAAPAAGRLAADAGGPTALPDIVTYYRSMRPPRLVVTGAAGAGKTVLALELLVALLEDRSDEDPVPVRIPLPRWDTECQSLPELLQQRLTEDYDWPAELAAEMVRDGRVLPVLDGLDEMDPLQADGTPDPRAPRALAALKAFNSVPDGRALRALVITCRTEHYEALSPTLWLTDAAHVAVAPVATPDALVYLQHRARDVVRWQPLLSHLSDHVNRGTPSALADALSSPWRLSLVATVYRDEGDPLELTHQDTDRLEQHLMARLIPVVTYVHPSPQNLFGRPRAYHPDQVHRWLSHLARALAPVGTAGAPAPGGAGTDLVLHKLWPLAGRTRVRLLDAMLTGAMVLLALVGVLLAVRPLLPVSPGSVLPGVVISVVTVVIALMATAEPGLSRVEFHLPPDRARHVLVVGLVAGVAAGRAAGLAFGRAASPVAGPVVAGAAGLIAGLVVAVVTGAAAAKASDVMLGVMYGLLIGTEGPPSHVAHPWGLLRHDLMAKLASSLVLLGVVLGGGIGLIVTETFGSESGLATGLSLVLIILLTFGVGLVAARRYAVFLLCSWTVLPFRLVVFLDWACEAGLLRRAGPAYQFRHRELQEWLAQRPLP